MRLTDDLTHPGWLVAKGVLFGALTLLASALCLIADGLPVRAGALAVALWASARTYFFAFHVLERWVGLPGRYAGLVDLARRLWALRRPRK